MVLFFKHWIKSNEQAHCFLKKHNGFNFMLKRLFEDTIESQQERSLSECSVSSDYQDSDEDNDSEIESLS